MDGSSGSDYAVVGFSGNPRVYHRSVDRSIKVRGNYTTFPGSWHPLGQRTTHGASGTGPYLSRNPAFAVRSYCSHPPFLALKWQDSMLQPQMTNVPIPTALAGLTRPEGAPWWVAKNDR